jgi:pyridoxal phosphate enzyme (YggS family)
LKNIKGNLKRIKDNINQVVKDSGREGQEVLLCCVTKTRTSEEINEAINEGVTDIGENKVQEILDKYDFIDPCRWHLIGHLQTNKVKYIVDKVFMIHSVDSLRLAEEINRRCIQADKTMNILIQVNAAMEDTKFGIQTEETEKLLREILETCENIVIKGLMVIAPFYDNPEDARQYFRKGKELYDCNGKIQHKNLDFEYLSMGMSNDYEVAIEEGSNIVRIGTAIFGERDYSKKV